ncbi:MAG: TolC family protein, partial [Planctomycetaceae bacterium]|nr:TolC family protein [Planctomycetaceae bacterium]
MICPSSAEAQKQLADDLIVIAGQRGQERQRDQTPGSVAPGAAYNRLGPQPGSGQTALRPIIDTGRVTPRRDLLSAAANPLLSTAPMPAEIIAAPPSSAPMRLPGGGSLDRPKTDEEGPSDGLTLDAAIGIVADQSLTLRAKFQEIPKATADILTAGLRANPLLFASVDEVPYGQYTPAAPGEVGYGVTVIQPIDINRKRVYRVIAAERARSVVQAQYQDAVRIEVDNLHLRFVDVLAARETVRYVEASLAGLHEVREAVERLARGQEVSSLEVDRIQVQIDAAEVARIDAVNSLHRAKQSLAAQLAVPSPDV